MKNWDIMCAPKGPMRQSLLPLRVGQEARQVNDGPVCQIHRRHEKTHSCQCNAQVKSWHRDLIAHKCVHRDTTEAECPTDCISKPTYDRSKANYRTKDKELPHNTGRMFTNRRLKSASGRVTDDYVSSRRKHTEAFSESKCGSTEQQNGVTLVLSLEY